MTDPRPSTSTVPSVVDEEMSATDELLSVDDPVGGEPDEPTEPVDEPAVATSEVESPSAGDASRAVAPGEVEVDCPECGLRVVGESPRPTAAWFCPRCDYPLFWASQAPPPSTPQQRARRRLPGTGGTVVLGSEPCWHCGEMSEPGVTECRRCAATLPKPMAPTVTIREEVPVNVPVPVVVRVTSWPFVAAGIGGGAAVAMAIVLWVLGAG